MTDRVYGLQVALDKDVRIDDVQGIIDAIKKIRGVCDVAADIAEPILWTAQTRARQELLEKILDLLIPDEGTIGGK